MIVGNLHVIGVMIFPGEANPIFVVDPDGVLAGSLTHQSVKLVSRRDLQIVQFGRGVHHVQLSSGYGAYIRWNRLA